MARQRIDCEQYYVEQQDKGADAYAESSAKKEAADGIPPEKNEEDEPRIKKIAVQILKNKREFRFASVAPLPRFADSAGRRVEKESPIVSLAVVVSGDPESEGENQYQ